MHPSYPALPPPTPYPLPRHVHSQFKHMMQVDETAPSFSPCGSHRAADDLDLDRRDSIGFYDLY